MTQQAFNVQTGIEFSDKSTQATAYRSIHAQGKLTTNQSVPAGQDTAVLMVADLDPNGLYDGNAVIIGTAGTYEVCLSVLWAPNSTNSDTGQINVQIHKNTDQVFIAQTQINVTQPMTQGGSVLINCVVGDAITATAYTSGTTGQTINSGNGTRLSVKLI